ncbi:MAG TPA: DUF892 family protein [Candidatus Paceibacterota bacterium]|nr:DUF892 family protein [Candidatus Paceibacterota bacterium]
MAAKKKQARQRSPKHETLYDLFVLKLGALLDIEEQITKALPKFAKAASNEELREAFMEHLEETKQQTERLHEIFGMLDVAPKKTRVEAIRGMAEDSEWIIKSVKSPSARDALLIASAQYVEHYEMSGYESAIAWAEILDVYDAVGHLRDTLKEEQAASKKLAGIAQSAVNEAVPISDEEET